MTSGKRIDSNEAVHRYLHEAGEVTYSLEISEASTVEHEDMFEVYLYDKKLGELNPALLVLKENGEIIPTATAMDASYYIDEYRAGRWFTDFGEIDEAALCALDEFEEFEQRPAGPDSEELEIIEDSAAADCAGREPESR